MIEYDENWLYSVVLRWDGGTWQRAMVWSIPGAALSVLILHLDHFHTDFRSHMGIEELNEGTCWSALTVVLVALLVFRVKMSYNRFWEGTSLLHMMKGEWFDTVSNCVSFTKESKINKPKEVMTFRHTLTRLMSLAHASALEEISEMKSELETIDTFGLDIETLHHLRECVEDYRFNKVEVLLHLIQTVITDAANKGVFSVAPPIVSRVYQTCSRGYVHLLNAKKIVDTRFPFPLVQALTSLLLLHMIVTPMLLSAVIKNAYMLAFVTFIVLTGVHTLNFTAIELENPFGQDDNDLPLNEFQKTMNSCLLMLLHDRSDILPGVNRKCIHEFNVLFTEGQSMIPSHSALMKCTASTDSLPGVSKSSLVSALPSSTSPVRITRFSSIALLEKDPAAQRIPPTGSILSGTRFGDAVGCETAMPEEEDGYGVSSLSSGSGFISVNPGRCSVSSGTKLGAAPLRMSVAKAFAPEPCIPEEASTPTSITSTAGKPEQKATPDAMVAIPIPKFLEDMRSLYESLDQWTQKIASNVSELNLTLQNASTGGSMGRNSHIPSLSSQTSLLTKGGVTTNRGRLGATNDPNSMPEDVVAKKANESIKEAPSLQDKQCPDSINNNGRFDAMAVVLRDASPKRDVLPKQSKQTVERRVIL